MSVPADSQPRRGGRGPIVFGTLLLVVALGLALSGISGRNRALAEVTRETEERAVPVVAVVTPTTDAPAQEIVLPGTMQPLADAPIYARTNGYVRKWYVDIGGAVRAGQLLAELDAPEVEHELQQARADLASAEANASLAKTTAERYRDLIKDNAVSRQDLDNANGGLEVRLAVVESARANVKRLEQLMAFTRIEAPFAGIVTARNIDVGALVDSGNNARELFHVADTRTLRVFVNVPEVYSQVTRPGLAADLTLREFSGRRFTGRLARTANAIDVNSRTLLTEVDVDNSKHELLPGSYCDVHFKLASSSQPTLKLPVNSLIFRSEGLQVATVRGGSRVALQPITVGRDFGTSVEVLAGVNPTDQVIVNPPDSIAAGEEVRVRSEERAAE
jgi:RND family efflux transporter MFP subunit